MMQGKVNNIMSILDYHFQIRLVGLTTTCSEFVVS